MKICYRFFLQATIKKLLAKWNFTSICAVDYFHLQLPKFDITSDWPNLSSRQYMFNNLLKIAFSFWKKRIVNWQTDSSLSNALVQCCWRNNRQNCLKKLLSNFFYWRTWTCTYVTNLGESKKYIIKGASKRNIFWHHSFSCNFSCEDPPKFAFWGCIMRKSFNWLV